MLYAYLMHCHALDIPSLKFPRDEIIEIIPAAYQNEAKRIHIPGLDSLVAAPGSPELFRVSSISNVPGNLTHIPGMSSPPELVVTRPPEKVINTSKDRIADKVGDED